MDAATHSKLVLIADDEAVHRMLMRRALTKTFSDFEILEVNSAAEARKVLSRLLAKMRLVILDFNLGDGCGLELLREIRATKEGQGLPCIIVSTSDHARDIWESYKAGCNAYLIKSEDPEHYQACLISAVRFFLSF